MSIIKKYFSFYILNAVASTLATLSIFLSIEENFHKFVYLGIVLSLRMLSTSVFSYILPHIIGKIKIKSTLLFCQILSVLTLILLSVGFYFKLISIVFLATLIVGIPFAIVSIIFTICIRDISDKDKFRKLSGNRELVFGLCRLFACIVTPLALMATTLNVVLVLTSCLYVMSYIIIASCDFNCDNKTVEKRSGINLSILKNKASIIFTLKLLSSWLLIALIPYVASSDLIKITYNPIYEYIKKSLFSVEALTMIFGSALYVYIKKLKTSMVFDFLSTVNGVFLIFLIFSSNIYNLVAVVTLISLMIMFSFNVLRDNYVLEAGDNVTLINQRSAFSMALRDFICMVSPLFLELLISHFNIQNTIVSIIGLQLVLYLAAKLVLIK